MPMNIFVVWAIFIVATSEAITCSGNTAKPVVTALAATAAATATAFIDPDDLSNKPWKERKKRLNRYLGTTRIHPVSWKENGWVRIVCWPFVNII